MKIKFLILILILGILLPVSAQDEIVLSITCTCNAARVEWINNYVIPEFEKLMAEQGKNVTVELIDYELADEAYREQLALDFSLEQGNDVVGFDGFWMPEFVSNGLLRPLNEVSGEQVDEWDGWEHIPEGVQNILTFEGERYGVPIGTDVRAIFYNIDLFEAAGIEMPWQPESWDDLLATARQLKEAGVEIPLQLNAGMAMGEATTMQGFFMLLLGGGHHLYDFEENKWIVSSPAILDVLNFYKSVYGDEQLGHLDFQLSEDGRDQSFAAFREGRVGMYVEGDFFWRTAVSPAAGFENREERVGWAMMPAHEAGMGYNEQDFVTISGGAGWVLNPNTPNPDVAWALLSFMTGQAAAEELQNYDPRISFRDDVEVAGDPILTNIANALLPYTTVRPLLPEYPLVSLEVQLMTERVITGEMTPEEAMAAFAEAVSDIVGEENVISLD